MKASYRTRLLNLTEAVLSRHKNQLATALQPLLVLHSPLLPETGPNEIACARSIGRPVVHVRFVDAEDGKPCLKEQQEPPPYIVWGQEIDAPRVIETTIRLLDDGNPCVTQEEVPARYGGGCKPQKSLESESNEPL